MPEATSVPSTAMDSVETTASSHPPFTASSITGFTFLTMMIVKNVYINIAQRKNATLQNMNPHTYRPLMTTSWLPSTSVPAINVKNPGPLLWFPRSERNSPVLSVNRMIFNASRMIYMNRLKYMSASAATGSPRYQHESDNAPVAMTIAKYPGNRLRDWRLKKFNTIPTLSVLIYKNFNLFIIYNFPQFFNLTSFENLSCHHK